MTAEFHEFNPALSHLNTIFNVSAGDLGTAME